MHAKANVGGICGKSPGFYGGNLPAIARAEKRLALIAALRTTLDAAARIRAAREAAQLDETVARGKACLTAGADCVDPIALLERLGVARVGGASQVALMAPSATRRIEDELRPRSADGRKRGARNGWLA